MFLSTDYAFEKRTGEVTIVHFFVYVINWPLVWIWYCGEEFPIDFLPLFMFLYISEICLLFLF